MQDSRDFFSLPHLKLFCHTSDKIDMCVLESIALQVGITGRENWIRKYNDMSRKWQTVMHII